MTAVYVINEQKVIKSTYMNFDDNKCPCLEEDDETQNVALSFENQGYLEDLENDADEFVVQENQVNEEIKMR